MRAALLSDARSSSHIQDTNNSSRSLSKLSTKSLLETLSAPSTLAEGMGALTRGE